MVPGNGFLRAASKISATMEDPRNLPEALEPDALNRALEEIRQTRDHIDRHAKYEKLSRQILEYLGQMHSHKRRKMVWDDTVDRIVERHDLGNLLEARRLCIGVWARPEKFPECPLTQLPNELAFKVLNYMVPDGYVFSEEESSNT